MVLKGRTSIGAGRWLRRGVAVSLVAVGSLFTGCAGTEVDEKRAREAILYDVEQQTGTKIEWVKCPSGVEVVPGTRFECTVKASDGRMAVASMEVLNLDADVRFISLKPSAG